MKTCAVCGKTFPANRKNQKTCSDECRKEFRRRNALQYKRKRFGETRQYTKTCVICGKTFVTNKQFQVTCSRACSTVHSHRQTSERRKKERLSRLTAGEKRMYIEGDELPPRHCLQCGKLFRPYEIKLDKYGIHPAGLNFCCYQCCENYFKGGSNNENDRHDLCCS